LSFLALFVAYKNPVALPGDIWAESEVDVGSLFSFYLPAAKLLTPPEAADRARREANNFPTPVTGSSAVNPSNPIHVLLTEDNHINQTLLRRKLTGAGCIVAVANDGIEALEYVQASNAAVDQGHVLDCILMDIEMPRMGGIECTKRIRDLENAGYLRHHIPIIAVSANTRVEQVKVVSRL
jgi:CheY-like chemotaxis protein